MTFDPFVPETATTVLESKFRPTLVARARKRQVSDTGGGEWIVTGDKKLGDSLDKYLVHYRDRKYQCSCYTSLYGEVRKAKVCSHALAVMLHRREAGQGTASRLARSGEGEVEADSPSAPSPPSPVELRGDVPAVDDLRFAASPLPGWVKEIRPWQWDAVQEIVEEYDRGADVVWLDAPTGAGKTLIGELVRREMKARTMYVCSTKSLQDQFVKDFPTAAVLKGRSNYATQDFPFPDVTCNDCTKTSPDDDCNWCNDPDACAYPVAKNRALASPLTVVNTAYLLSEANYVGRMIKNRQLVVADECDVLESELMGFVEFVVGDGRLRQLKVQAPPKGSHKPTIASWLVESLVPAAVRKKASLPASKDVKTLRQRSGLTALIDDAKRIAEELTGPNAATWIRDNKAEALVLKPVRVSGYGDRYLWRHSPRWLAMSATIISADQLADDLGVEGRHSTVRVPMQFDVERRRIHVTPIADMANKNRDSAWPAMVDGVRNILANHPSERILVHAVSYALAGYLCDRLGDIGRPVITYRDSGSRDDAISRYRRSPNAVIVAPSLDRGVDFKGDDCRVVVVAKVPFPNLGDQQVSARLNGRGGSGWYAVNTVRTLVQMTGRGVRASDDWCKTYILDGQFVKNIWHRNRELLPRWWRDAVVFT